MKIGDKVRFLSQTGGGIVVGFDKRGRVLVEDEDEFQIPMPTNECVVVEENTVGKTQSSSVSTNSATKVIQTKTGEELNLAIVYTKEGSSNTSYNCTAANESNYTLLLTYSIIYKGLCTTVYAGEILPYERKLLFTFGKDALNDGSKKVQIRAIPFKKERSNGVELKGEFNKYKGVDEKKMYNPKSPIEKEFTLDAVNLLKESLFKENEYLSGKGYAITIIKEGEKNPDNLKELQRELAEKFRGDVQSAPQNGQNNQNKAGKFKSASQQEDDDSIIKITSNGILEVDLHAHELLDTTSGMGNTEILLYQLSKFNEIMVANLHKRGAKIVFIDGKGDGVLRQALLKELKTKYSRCSYQDASFKEYGFGATMVTI